MATSVRPIVGSRLGAWLAFNTTGVVSAGNVLAKQQQQQQQQQQHRRMSGKKRGASSHRYMERQQRDPFVKQAQMEQLRARSSFKLVELMDKHRLVPKAPMCVVDCGAAPGGWSQVVARKLGPCGRTRIVAVDILPMQAIPGVQFIKGDFLDAEIKHQVAQVLDGRKVGLLLSDMAPSFTGHHSVDADRTMNLCEDVVAFSKEILAPGGAMVLKFFMGGGEAGLRKELRCLFETVLIEKPQASRKQSSEQYLVCLGKKP